MGCSDRMLVRASYTEAGSVGVDFDESQDRVDPHIESDNWLEYIVAWRKDGLELYRDHVRFFLCVTECVLIICVAYTIQGMADRSQTPFLLDSVRTYDASFDLFLY